MNAKSSRGPWLWPLAVVLLGILLLLKNFLFLNLDVTTFWPLLLVVAGAVILLRGDLIPNTEARAFGITRGSVEAATLEIHSAEIDVSLRPLTQEGRLIAGQFAQNARPALSVADTHTHLLMERAATNWLSFADWEMAVARDLPWHIFITTSLGQLKLDLSSVIVAQLQVGTGFGDIQVTAPREALANLSLRSALGTLHLITPYGHKTRVTINGGRFFTVHVDPLRYQQLEPAVYEALDADPAAPIVLVELRGTFGAAYLA